MRELGTHQQQSVNHIRYEGRVGQEQRLVLSEMHSSTAMIEELEGLVLYPMPAHFATIFYQRIYLLLCERKIRVGLIAPEDTACGSARHCRRMVLGHHGQTLTDLSRIRSRRHTELFYQSRSCSRHHPARVRGCGSSPCSWLPAAGSEYNQRKQPRLMLAQPIHSSRSERRNSIGTLLEKP